MKVSIITATYNSAATLEQTIRSVMAQDYKDIEYIIIDGGSTDDTLGIVRRHKSAIARVVSEPDRGIYDAMNKGISLATGDIIGLLNSDDIFAAPTVVSQVVAAFEAEPALEGVHGDLYYVRPDNTDRVVRYWHTKEYSAGSFARGWHPAHPTFYVRREVYAKYGTFDLSFPLSADFELMLRLFECRHIRTRHLDTVMVRMRVGGATSKNAKAVWQGMFQCRRAFRVNGLKPPVLYPVYRLVPKLMQYVRR